MTRRIAEILNLADRSTEAEAVQNIEAALAATNGGAWANTIKSAATLVELAEMAEARLERSGLPKSCRCGVVATYTPAGPGKSYARRWRTVRTTTLTLRRRAGCGYDIAVRATPDKSASRKAA